MNSWFDIDTTQFMGILLTTAIFYLGLLLFIRVNGLRSFSKMSGHDFAVTIAIGSVFASTILSDTPHLSQGLFAVALLLLYKKLASILRLNSTARKIIDNTPLILMKDGEMIEANLKKAEVSKDDIYAKLRESNVLNMSQVRAVVIEATGDVSVLHGTKEEYDSKMLTGCRV